jgi:DNA adenine methylase
MKVSELRRSPLRWAGSKKKLLPHLIRLAPKGYDRYVEPFCGSMCLAIALKPRRALIGDINKELVNFYKCMKKNARGVAELTQYLPRDAETYYKVRALSPKDLAPDYRAARFLYLNRFCFNGVYRTNLLGEFNVPRGNHTGEIPAIEELVAFGSLLTSVTIKRCDFSVLLEQAGEGDFVYLDPPYAGRNVRDRGEYGVGAFKEPDIDRLILSINEASERGAKVLLSYADIPRINDAFKDWITEYIKVPRNVSGFSKGRAVADEIIVRNYA